MASQVDIGNLALSNFGQDANISDFAEQSVEAELCRRFYPIARDELLEEYNWTFARKRALLAALVNDRTDVLYKYARPADCLRERRVLPDGYTSDLDDEVEFQREANVIYSDAALATLVYTFNLTDTTRFSPLFVTALSFRLSSYIIGPIIKDPTGRSATALRTKGDQLAASAKISDANIDRKRVRQISTAEAVRGGYVPPDASDSWGL